MIKKYLVILTIATLVTGMLLCTGNAKCQPNTDKICSYPDPYASHANIVISGDSQFTPNATNGVVSGTGTKIDPYIIEAWDINASLADGIKIENTNAYFIIKNCIVHDGEFGGSVNYGLYLSVANNGSVENCSFLNDNEGIHLWEIKNGSFTYNHITSNSLGISIGHSSELILSHNNICFNHGVGLSMSWSAHNQIVYNNITDNSNYSVKIISPQNYSYIHHNNFINNNAGGIKQASDTSVMTYWNTSGEGNHWSDWTAPDTSPKDGIVDNPYILDGGKGANDSYPLVEPIPDSGNGSEVPEFSLILPLTVAFVLLATLIMVARDRKY